MTTAINKVDAITHRGRVVNNSSLLHQYNEAVLQTVSKIDSLIKKGLPYNKDQILAEFLARTTNPFDILNAVYSNGKLIQSVITSSKSSITNPQYATGIGQGGPSFIALTVNSDLNLNASTLPAANGVSCGDGVDTRDSLFAPVNLSECMCIQNLGKDPSKNSLYTQKRRVDRNSKSIYILNQAKMTVEAQIDHAIKNGQPYDKDALYAAAILNAFQFIRPNWNEQVPGLDSTNNISGSSSIVTDNQRLNIIDVTDPLLRNQRLQYKSQLNVIDDKARESALARYNKAIQLGLIPNVPPPNPTYDQYLEDALKRVEVTPDPQDPLIPTTTVDAAGNMSVKRYNAQKRGAARAVSKVVAAAVAARTAAKKAWLVYLATPSEANLAAADVALLKAVNATQLAFVSQGWTPPDGDDSLNRS